MAEDVLGIAQRDLGVLEQGGRGVAQAVQTDARQPSAFAVDVEAAADVVGIDGLAGRGGEDQAVAVCGGPREAAEVIGGRREERQIASGGCRLDVHEVQAGLEALHLSADAQDAGIEVDVRPAQSHGLATAQSVEAHEQERPVVVGVLGGVQELAELLGRPGHGLFGGVPRWPDQAGDVAVDEFFAAGLAQGGTEDFAEFGDHAC